MHNHAIFQNGRPDHSRTGSKAIIWLNSYAIKNQKVPNMRTVYTLADQQGIVGYFDGAEQGGFCGVGMLIRVNQTMSFRLKLSIGLGTNTKSELLMLWGLLYFTKIKEILPNMVLGDSKVIVDWERGSYNLHTIQLLHWNRRTKDLIEYFQHITFLHIYQELNIEVDDLSKLTIDNGMKSIEWAKFYRATCLEQGTINIS